MNIRNNLSTINISSLSLKDYKGKKIVLYFYPKDMTSGCTAEACDFRDNIKKFEKKNTVVIGVSPDAPNFSNATREAGEPEVERAKAKVSAHEAAKPVAENRKAKEKIAHKDEEPARKKDQDKKEKDKKEKPSPAAKTESRPRRVG